MLEYSVQKRTLPHIFSHVVLLVLMPVVQQLACRGQYYYIPTVMTMKHGAGKKG